MQHLGNEHSIGILCIVLQHVLPVTNKDINKKIVMYFDFLVKNKDYDRMKETDVFIFRRNKFARRTFTFSRVSNRVCLGGS